MTGRESTEPLTPARLAEIAEDHWQANTGQHAGWCDFCGDGWPCGPKLLLAEVDRLTEALAAERARVQRVEAGPIAEIADQRARNHAKWGERSIENRQPDYAGWLPTLGEEFGEVCRAQTLEDASTERLRSELIDTVAVALMWIDSIDRAALAGDTEGKS